MGRFAHHKIEGQDITRETLYVIDRLDKETVRNFNRICSKKTGTVLFAENDTLSKIYSTNYDQLMRLSDVGLIRMNLMSTSTVLNVRQNHQLRIGFGDSFIVCVFPKETKLN